MERALSMKRIVRVWPNEPTVLAVSDDNQQLTMLGHRCDLPSAKLERKVRGSRKRFIDVGQSGSAISAAKELRASLKAMT